MTHKIPWLPDWITGGRKIFNYKGKINSECKDTYTEEKSLLRESGLGGIKLSREAVTFKTVKNCVDHALRCMVKFLGCLLWSQKMDL